MKCPLCKDDLLHSTTLELGLPAYRCQQCQGVWISLSEYRNWRREKADALPELALDDTDIPLWDTQELKLCPNCARFLTRHRILPGVKFYLDRCGNCEGVWFDPHEWEVVVARNLQDKVHLFFTKPWQIKMQAEEARRMLDRLYLDKFGPEDYAKVKDVWAWVRHHPQRAMLIAYLQADDPYKI